MKNKILLVLLAVSMMAVFSSCNVGSMLVGTKWTDEVTTYSFEKDGVLKVTGQGLVGKTTVTGTYSSEGNVLTYEYNLFLDFSGTVTVEFAKTTMVWLNKDGEIVKTLRRLDD